MLALQAPSIGCVPPPLIPGAVSGGGVGRGATLQLSGYWSGTLHFGENMSLAVKRKTGFHVSKPPPLASPTCLPLH